MQPMRLRSPDVLPHTQRSASEGAGALPPAQHGRFSAVLRTGGVGAERAADGPLNDEPSRVRCGFVPAVSLSNPPSPRNPGGELTYLENGSLFGVFSGGGRTDSVEAFAGAQGQRGERGFEHGG